MKKLALALMCFASVAFFASCTQEILHPEPSLAVVTGENYVYDGQTIDIETEYMLGFRAASNSQTLKELSTFNLNVKILELDGTVVSSHDTLMNISGTEFIYDHVLNFTMRELVGKTEITATVTDVDSKTATTTITLNVNQPAHPLVARTIEWTRKGGNLLNDTEAEMAACGLKWVSRDAFHANIRPETNCTLYVIENAAADFEGVTTDVEKAAYFVNLMETATSVEEYRNISVAVTGDKTYNDVLAVIDAEGNQHLVLFEKANVQTGTFGVQTIITGKAK